MAVKRSSSIFPTSEVIVSDTVAFNKECWEFETGPAFAWRIKSCSWSEASMRAKSKAISSRESR